MTDFDASKTVTTRCDYPAVIHTTDGPDPNFPIVFSYKARNGIWETGTARSDGRFDEYGKRHSLDLINPSEPVDQFVNVYESCISAGHPDKCHALAVESPPAHRRIAMVHLRIHPNRKPGEGMVEIVSEEGI